MAAVTICSDFGTQNIWSVTVSRRVREREREDWATWKELQFLGKGCIQFVVRCHGVKTKGINHSFLPLTYSKCSTIRPKQKPENRKGCQLQSIQFSPSRHSVWKIWMIKSKTLYSNWNCLFINEFNQMYRPSNTQKLFFPGVKIFSLLSLEIFLHICSSLRSQFLEKSLRTQIISVAMLYY